MRQLILACLVVYAPHLLEEHFTGMWNDALIVAAFEPLSGMPARQSAYLLFQLMLALSLGMTFLFRLGGKGRDFVMVGLAAALVAESHHIVRAIATHEYNSGLVTSLPMPVVGAVILWRLFRRRSDSTALVTA
jgi:hypothetical protein